MIKVIINLILYSLFLNSGFESEICNRKSNIFFVILFGIYTGRRILKSNSTLVLAFTVLLDYFIPKLLVKTFYNSSYKFSNDYHSLLIVLIIFITFSFIPKDTIKENNQSTIFHTSYTQLNSLFSSYKFFYFFTYTVNSQLLSQNRRLKPLGQNDFLIHLLYFFLDFVIMNCGFLIRTSFKIFTSKSKRVAYIRALFNILSLFLLVNVFFYLNFSDEFLIFCKEIRKLLPSYIGNTIYNSVSESAERRFKYALIGLFSYFI